MEAALFLATAGLSAANQLSAAQFFKVPLKQDFEPPIVPKIEANQKARGWDESQPVYPMPVVAKQKTGIVPVAESHPIDVKAASRRLQASCPSPPPPAPIIVPSTCPAYPNLQFLNASMGFSGIPSIPILLPGQRNATTGTYIESSGLFEWTSDCPVAINLGRNEDLYTKVFVQPRWKLKYAWETSQTFILFPDWNRIPFFIPAGANSFNTYNWFGTLNAEFTFQPIPNTFQDFYHRSTTWGWCGEAMPATARVNCTAGNFGLANSGYVYLTIHAIASEFKFPESRLTGRITVSTIPPTLTYIKPAQLNALRDIYNTMCKPTQDQLPIWNLNAIPSSINRHWRRSEYQAGAYSHRKPTPGFLYLASYNSTGREEDTDEVPYCDWLFTTRLDSVPADRTVVLDTPPGLAGAGNCERIDYVLCDAAGDVIEIDLDSLGLTGTLPASFVAFDKLKNLYLRENKITGTLPSSIFASPFLERVFLGKNFITGPIPCPMHRETALTMISLERNLFTGTLPDCLFTDAPYLQNLDLSYLDLDTTIPSTIEEATQLTSLTMRHAGLGGNLPQSMRCNEKLMWVSLERNKMSGTVPSDVVGGMGALYELGLSYNDFSGPIPTIPNTSSAFRHLYLDHNRFSGQFQTQLEGWTANLDASTSSRLYLDHNDLSGPLPSYLYELMTDAHGIKQIQINENHFLCDQQRGDWPAWVFRRGTEEFGVCTPLAMVTSATVPNPGSIVVTGTNFLPSTELQCKIINSVTSVETIINAGYRSPTEVECLAGTAAVPTLTYVVQVANYGTDFYSPTLAGSAYVMRTVVIPADPARTLTTSFVASGDVSSYTAARQAVMRAAFAAQAGVPVDCVIISVTAASVNIAVEIVYPTPVAAVSAAVGLTAPGGLFQSAASLEQVLQIAGVPVTVTEITAAPQVIAQNLSLGEIKEVLSVGAVIAIVVAVVAACFMCICCSHLIQRERAGKPVFKPVGGSVGAVTLPSATTLSSSSAAAFRVHKV